MAAGGKELGAFFLIGPLPAPRPAAAIRTGLGKVRRLANGQEASDYVFRQE